MQGYVIELEIVGGIKDRITADLPHDDAARAWADDLVAEIAEDGQEVKSLALYARGFCLDRR